ncbi:MAG: hypothetical protein AB7K36_31065 [Chloroflexota bacterium]
MSKYAPLAQFLAKQPGPVTTLAFSQIEQLIDDTLPPSARKYQQWWENDSGSERHVQAEAWIRTGWLVADFSLPDETVTFVRSNGSIVSQKAVR